MGGNSIRYFNVFSERIVVGPGEEFGLMVNPSEMGTDDGIGVTVTGVSLTPGGPYDVEPKKPVTVTAPNTAGQGTITCDPAPPGVETQNIIVASLMVSVCTSVQVDPGDYFIWQNPNDEPVLIKADPSNINDWPLPDEEHEVPANGWLPLQVPIDAILTNEQDNPAYLLKLTVNGKDFDCNPSATQPKLIVGSNK
jgi:hypothetical protein